MNDSLHCFVLIYWLNHNLKIAAALRATVSTEARAQRSHDDVEMRRGVHLCVHLKVTPSTAEDDNDTCPESHY